MAVIVVVIVVVRGKRRRGRWVFHLCVVVGSGSRIVVERMGGGQGRVGSGSGEKSVEQRVKLR